MKPCAECGTSERPGFVIFARYWDRRVPTDVIGEYRLTSGVDWARCLHCSGTGQEPATHGT